MASRMGGWELLTASAVALLMLSGAASAGEMILFDNGAAADVGGVTSDADPDNPSYEGRQAADSFILARGASTVTAIEWSGSYSVPNSPIDPAASGLRDQFSIVLYADDGGTPGSTVARFEPGHVQRTCDNNGVWSYRCELPAPLALCPDTPYHVAIANRLPGNAYWCWSVSDESGSSFSSAIKPLQWYEWPGDCAFLLLKSDAPAPNRHALPMVMGGVIGVLALRRYVL